MHAFANWQRRSQALELVPVHYPGHGTGTVEPCIADLAELVTVPHDRLASALDRPYAAFGHSFGALVAFEFARAARDRGAPVPDHLYLSACPAPDQLGARDPLFMLPDAELLGRLVALDGIPSAVADDPTLAAQILPALRADLRAFATYRQNSGPPLDVPVTVIGARSDPAASERELRAWRRETSSSFALRLFEGQHFYVVDEAESIPALQRG